MQKTGIKKNISEKLKRCWRWLKTNVFTKDMFLWIVLAEFIFWLPVIVCALLALIINPWYWTAASAIIVFWAGPFTPAMPIQFALAGGLKAMYNKCKKKKQDN